MAFEASKVYVCLNDVKNVQFIPLFNRKVVPLSQIIISIMEEAIKQIGERLKGLRDALDLTTDEVAKACGVTTEKYEQMDIFSFLDENKEEKQKENIRQKDKISSTQRIKIG